MEFRRSASLRRPLSGNRRILLATALITALAGSLNVVPVHASFISVSVTFTHNGKLPLQDRFQVLKHGCWNPGPRRSIPTLTTVTWESESCGLRIGTDGT